MVSINQGLGQSTEHAGKVQATRRVLQAHVLQGISNCRQSIAWLERDQPLWSCGTPVSPSDRVDLLQVSRQMLASLLTGSKLN